MSEVLHATDTASRVGLVTALERATAAGLTPTVEIILGALAERFPAGLGAGAAVRALNLAVNTQQWGTAEYLASYLADAAESRPRHASPLGGGGFSSSAENAGWEVLRCLRGFPEEPWRLSDAIENRSADREIEFALAVAGLGCPAADSLPRGEIVFRQADPELPPDVYGGADNPCGCFPLGDPTHSAWMLLDKADRVVPPGPIAVELFEPPEIAGQYIIKTADGSRASLVHALAGKYRELFSASGQPPGRDLSELSLTRVSPVGPRRFAVRLLAPESFL